MNSKTGLLLLFFLVVAISLRAADPLYSVTITPDQHFEFVGERATEARLSFYPQSESMTPRAKTPRGRKVIASDYAAAFAKIKTDNPSLAVQSILNQISRQTGLMLRKHINTSIAAMAPATMMQAFSETAVITVVLTPMEPEGYLVTCAYVIDERSPDSIDGTPAAIAQMEETLRLLTADSTAERLPDQVHLDEIKPGVYFRSPQFFNLPNLQGGHYPAAVLILRKGNDYALASYRNDSGQLTRLGKPVVWSGTKPPYVASSSGQTPGSPGNPPRLTQFRTGFRAENTDGKGGVQISFEEGAGHAILTPF